MAEGRNMDKKRGKKHPICTTIPNIKQVMKAHREDFEREDDSFRGKELRRIIGKRSVKRKDMIRYRSFRNYIREMDQRFPQQDNLIAALLRLYAISPEITVRQMISMIKLIYPDEYYNQLDWMHAVDMGPCIPNLDLVLEPY